MNHGDPPAYWLGRITLWKDGPLDKFGDPPKRQKGGLNADDVIAQMAPQTAPRRGTPEWELRYGTQAD